MSPLEDFMSCSPPPCLNTATAEDLCRCDAVGLRMSDRLIRARPFKSWDDVARVRGVGWYILGQLRARYERLSPLSMPSTVETSIAA